ncbi:hypothetical protein ACRRTK_018566 [Alexandromys fortis]
MDILQGLRRQWCCSCLVQTITVNAGSLYGNDENQGIDIPINSNSKLEEWRFGKRVLGASALQERQKWASVSTVENRKGAGHHGRPLQLPRILLTITKILCGSPGSTDSHVFAHSEQAGELGLMPCQSNPKKGLQNCGQSDIIRLDHTVKPSNHSLMNMDPDVRLSLPQWRLFGKMPAARERKLVFTRVAFVSQKEGSRFTLNIPMSVSPPESWLHIGQIFQKASLPNNRSLFPNSNHFGLKFAEQRLSCLPGCSASKDYVSDHEFRNFPEFNPFLLQERGFPHIAKVLVHYQLGMLQTLVGKQGLLWTPKSQGAPVSVAYVESMDAQTYRTAICDFYLLTASHDPPLLTLIKSDRRLDQSCGKGPERDWFSGRQENVDDYYDTGEELGRIFQLKKLNENE